MNCRLNAKALVAAVAVTVVAVMASSCSPTRRVAAGDLLLDKVTIEFAPGSEADVKPSDLQPYLRQSPNHKTLGLGRTQLGIYNMAGTDTLKWWNRWLRKMGEAPVVYDAALAEASRRQIEMAMVNRGYIDASVSLDTVADHRRRRMTARYTVNPATPMTIASLTVVTDCPEVADAVADRRNRLLTTADGSLLDRRALDDQRAAVASAMRDLGYYGLTKELITYVADTVAGSRSADVTMTIAAPEGGWDNARKHIGSVTIYTAGRGPDGRLRSETTASGITVDYGADHYLKASTLAGKCMVRPGALFSQTDLDRTYEGLTQLGILRSVAITTSVDPADPGLVDVAIAVERGKKQSIAFEVEGTNSEGDLGIGGSVTYKHYNLGHRSELLTLKSRVNYESISGDLEGLINDRYSEYSGEASITFPRFLFPFLSSSYRRRMRATSELSASINYQERPEYTRVIAGTGWKYRWVNRTNTNRRSLDLIDLQYVYLPKSTNDFINQIAPDNPLLRYSYEDHLIMRLGYSYRHTNRRAPGSGVLQPEVTTWRVAAETAGNVLYTVASLAGMHRSDGAYKVLGVPFSQYVKVEADLGYTLNLSHRHALAFRAAGGVACPYGNSTVVPFEKRFYAGGANGVRGWSVRTLGPGVYDSRNEVTAFINQCGDISLLMSAEYRARLFWVMEGALFVDGGNVWTIRNYPNQPGGLFKFGSFWREIAWSYGVGLRLDFTYFVVRLDMGMKAYNPALGQQRWPLTHPRWSRDAAIHFSVGYPF